MKDLSKILSNYKLVGGVALAFLLYFFYDEIKKLISGGTDTVANELDLFDKVENEVYPNSNRTRLECQIIANGLEDAFDYSSYGFYGTDEDAIKTLLDPSINADGRSLIYTTFGIRKYDGVGTPIGFMNPFSYEYNLSQWARAELEGQALQDMVTYFAPSRFTI